ncbi:MAG TPA: DinB family protein [Gemmatimonadaceae bacterium]|nr:DinB family protein [Gemmatimonadaceae bacterium]
MSARPVWLLGPVPGVPPLLQPVAHAILEAKEDVNHLLPSLADGVLWQKPAGAASVGFHVVHAAGSLDRLFTYARGSMLDDTQLAALAAEKTLDSSFGDAATVAAHFGAEVDRAVEQLRSTPESVLTEPRAVGRGKLPSTVIGLLVHAGDHTYRHVGQAITTARLLAARKT